MMLIMISARMFLEFCSAQARIRKEETDMKPQEDEIKFPGTLGRLSAVRAQNIGHDQVRRREAHSVNRICVRTASLRTRESDGERA